MRFRFLIVLLGIALASISTATPQGTFPVTLEQPVGEVTISSRPERIVVLGQSDMDTVLALDLTPVAGIAYTYSEGDVAPWLTDRLDPAKTVITPATTELSLEWVVTQRPDLILATGYWGVAEIYDQLSQIAPTVVGVPASVTDTWEDQVRLIGQAVGKTAQAEELIRATTAKIDATKAKYPAMAGKTFSLSYVYSSSEIATIYSKSDAAVRFFEQLGLRVAPQLAALEDAPTASRGSGILSFERLDLLDADMTVLAYDTSEYQQTVEASPLFQQLASVKAGHYSALSLAVVAELRIPTVLGLVWAVEQLEPALEQSFGSAP